jgi:hypothetical protein
MLIEVFRIGVSTMIQLLFPDTILILNPGLGQCIEKGENRWTLSELTFLGRVSDTGDKNPFEWVAKPTQNRPHLLSM